MHKLIKESQFVPVVRRSKMSYSEEQIYNQSFNGFAKKVRKAVETSVVTKQFWEQKVPVLRYAAEYDACKLTGDVVAGVTVALTIIPQGIACASIAGLPLQYGLYSSIVPGFVYAVFGTTKELSIGPALLASMLTFTYAGPSVKNAVTLAFYSGIIQVLMSLFRLGFLLNFVSRPVLSAFASAVAIRTSLSQIKGLLGIHISGRSFIDICTGIIENIETLRWGDTICGLSCILFLVLMKNDKGDADTTLARGARNLQWVTTISRNATVILVCSVLAYLLVEVAGYEDLLALTGFVQSGLPDVKLPWLQGSNDTQVDGNVEGPFEIGKDLGLGLILVPLVTSLHQTAAANYYSPTNKPVQFNQEIFAVGLANILGSFIGSWPVATSLSRSAVNAASGVKTPLSGIVTALLIILACPFLTTHFTYIPTAAISAIVITAIVTIIDFSHVLPMWRSDKLDLIPFAVTLVLGVLVRVDAGLGAGALVHLCILLFKATKVNVKLSEEDHDKGRRGCHLVAPDNSLFFPSSNKIRLGLSLAAKKAKEESLQQTNNNSDEIRPVIIDMVHVRDIDYGAAKIIRDFAVTNNESGQPVYLCNLNRKVKAVFNGLEFPSDHIFNNAGSHILVKEVKTAAPVAAWKPIRRLSGLV